MAKLPRGLCVILTALGLAGTRPPAASRVESPHSNAGWGIREFEAIAMEAPRLRGERRYAELEALYRDGLEQARRLGHNPAQVRYLIALGNLFIPLYRFTEAIAFYAEAASLAEEARDWPALVSVSPGLSSVYYQVGDLPAARAAIEQGMAALARLDAGPEYRAPLLLQRARLLEDGPELETAAVEGIEAARAWQHPDAPMLEAQGWDLLGAARMRRGDFAAAQRAIDAAYVLRLRHSPHHLRLSYQLLGQLEMTRAGVAAPRTRVHRLRLALRYTDAAIESARTQAFHLELRVLLHQRGRIRQALGDPAGALQDFGAAVEIGERWRLVVPGDHSSLVAANSGLDRDVYRSFIEAAAAQALATGDPVWAVRAFLAAERNRAASLRQSAELAPAWRQKLPPRYWTTLAELRAARAAEFRSTSTPSLATDRLQLELAAMEAAAGLGETLIPSENFPTETSLIHLQQGLGESDLFVSFHLGEQRSYLWSTSKFFLRMYPLPPAREIEAAAGRFREAVRDGREEAKQSGASLYRMLFGQLGPTEMNRSSWLVAPEGGLFEVPWAALVVTAAAGGDVEYLVERHSLQVVPSALWLTSRRGEPGAKRLAVADPIYNAADPRHSAEPWYQAWFLAPAQAGAPLLNRLPGSAAEVNAAAAVWRAQTGGAVPIEILEGARATARRFVSALKDGQTGIIHLATHAVTAGNRNYLAFSLGANGSPELLGPSDVALTNAPGALVVMTGCASGDGEVRAGAGLLGLTRGWLVAGAGAVAATLWPVGDTPGGLIPAFYQQLAHAPPAEALRRAQLAMLRSDGWQAAPAYWASYQITGGAR
jgi:CHAT domain-containing protein/tetratricopeptide (TPR) repeat protein